MSKKLDSKEVELFLLDNLDFFETRESLVSEMSFKHSSSSASSILERQVNKLREDHKSLINMLTSFMETASINEDLFNKSKNLTLQILESSTRKQIINKVENSFSKDFKVDKPLLKFHKNKKIDELEKLTGLSLHKGAIHCGSLSSEKMNVLFNDKKIGSMVVAVIVVGDEIGLLMLGSFDRSKYLGDEDTTFIEYIRDVLEKKLAK
tara:strand:- start:108 stop:728 length:621 start_codon:yes stop_codon:yes gene_type:complete